MIGLVLYTRLLLFYPASFFGVAVYYVSNTHPQFMYVNMRMDRFATIDIDSWTYETRPQSDLARSYSSGGQPPSIGDVRQMVVSEPSGSNQMSSDGQPPSVNDICRREPSQSEPSCTRYEYEGSDAHEVQQPGIWETGVEKKHNINPELWRACAGPLVNLPAAGTHVVYFPQGHSEQVSVSFSLS
ncbi:unnamed protein product [Lactuca virosa]|uniref:Auxin response factor domain-containing protein n=1 Tax=Lactuca virosa TaxID=75947 RepID=A0AAU9MLX4_9ASTR|nr:unnamed protein product [Lactuca virosa]